MRKFFYFMVVGFAFTVLQVATVEALPSTGVDEADSRTSTDLVACTDADKDREACRGDMAKETLQSQAGKDISAGGQQAIINPEEKGSGKAEGEIINFNSELACTEEDKRDARCVGTGDSAGASTGGTGSSPERK